MIKAIRFLGTLIIGLANLIKFLSSTLKLLIFFSFVMGIMVGVMVGFLGLVSPEYGFYGHIAWDIIAVVIGVGLLYLAWDKTKIQDKNYQKNIDILKDYDGWYEKNK